MQRVFRLIRNTSLALLSVFIIVWTLNFWRSIEIVTLGIIGDELIVGSVEGQLQVIYTDVNSHQVPNDLNLRFIRAEFWPSPSIDSIELGNEPWHFSSSFSNNPMGFSTLRFHISLYVLALPTALFAFFMQRVISRRTQKIAESKCVKCGYDVRGQKVCSECGGLPPLC